MGGWREQVHALVHSLDTWKPGPRNPIQISHVDGRDPTCCFPGCVPAGSWNWVRNQDSLKSRHSNVEHMHPNLQTKSPPLCYQFHMSYYSREFWISTTFLFSQHNLQTDNSQVFHSLLKHSSGRGGL